MKSSSIVSKLVLFVLPLLCILNALTDAKSIEALKSRVSGATTDDSGQSRSFHVIAAASRYDNGTVTPLNVGVEIISSGSSEIYTMKSTPGESSALYHAVLPSQGQDGGNFKYRYVMLQPNTQNIVTAESFYRTFVNGKYSTLNEFYNRENTIQQQTIQFPTASDQSILPTGFKRATNRLHRFNEVVTIHLQASPEEIRKMHENYKDEVEVTTAMTYISSDAVKKFAGCTLSISGRSSKHFTKLPYKLKLSKKDDLGGYRKFKLRSAASDPSYLREKLTSDLLYAVGRPASQTSYVRLLINDQAIGLFLLEEVYNGRWLKMEFNQGEKGYDNGVLYKALGAIVQEKKYADLSYHPEDMTYYDGLYKIEEKSEVNDKGIQDLVGFTQFIDEQLKWQAQQSGDDQLDTSVRLWEQQLNVKGFLANMAVEFLMGSWDNYIQNAQNYYLYKQPMNQQVMDWVAWDFDFVLGNGPINMKALLEGDYRNFTGMTTRPLTKAVLRVPAFRRLFESQVSYINNHLLTPEVSSPVIDSLVLLLKSDILWDQGLPRVRSGKSFTDMIGVANGEGTDHMSVPLDYDPRSGYDFVVRVNQNVTIEDAIIGPTRFKSLMGIKEFIKEKVDNVNKALLKYN